jgi:hypothetical protein
MKVVSVRSGFHGGDTHNAFCLQFSSACALAALSSVYAAEESGGSAHIVGYERADEQHSGE